MALVAFGPRAFRTFCYSSFRSPRITTNDSPEYFVWRCEEDREVLSRVTEWSTFREESRYD